jgi:hypothetical protein
LPYEQWAETRDTLHLWTQVIGKVKLALTPFLNEWWNVALTLTCRGMTTGPMPAGPADLQIDVDFISQQVVLATSDGRRAFIDLIPRSVAEFHAAVTTQLRALGFDVTYSTVPSELPGPVPFEQDTRGPGLRRCRRAAVVAGDAVRRPGHGQVPDAVRRQEQPGAVLLGRIRPEPHPLQRPARACATRLRGDPGFRRRSGELRDRFLAG